MSQAEKNPREVELPVPWGYIAAKVYGSSLEKRVLLVHGILDNAGSFDRLMEYLPQDYQYVSIDLPGHGLSSHFPSGTALQFFDYVYSISLVLNALKWKTCIYIGHSFGAQLGTYFSILYPGRLEKIILIDALLPCFIEDIVSYIRDSYNLYSYSKGSEILYTEDQVMYALQFRRREALKESAAKALFKRAVTKVDNLYKFNRDTRLKHVVKPIFTMEQQLEVFSKFSTKTLLIASHYTYENYMRGIIFNNAEGNNENKFSIVVLQGNHDIHNNYPERVAPHMCKFLSNALQSKL